MKKAQLLKALKRYGRHRENCNLVSLFVMTKKNGKPVGCDCGWEKIEKQIKQKGKS